MVLSETAATPSANSWRLETWFPDLNKEAHTKMRKLFDELTKANRTLSLISPKTVPFADGIHFADCILALQAIISDAPTTQEIYDLSLANGFPGLVAAIIYPKIKFIIVYTDDKKSEYLTLCIKELGLTNVSLKKSTIEGLPANSVRTAITRGVANISKMILASRKSFAKGGTLYHMKGETWGAEVGEIPTQLCSVWSPALVKEYRLPIGEVRFAVVKTEKIA